jgi:hypothetical protein
MDLVRGIVNRDDEIEIVLQSRNPTMLRTVLNSSISGNGRRAHLLRRAPRLAFATSPVACSDNGVTQSL